MTAKVTNNKGVRFDLLVIGGGAAGFYGAIQAAEMHPGLRIVIVEKSTKILSKVRVSGGGRCNVTHHCFDPVRLTRHYPRGQKPLRSIFRQYQASDTVAWFASRKVKLKTEADGRMFPVTDSSQTIVDCFLDEAGRQHIGVRTGVEAVSVKRTGDHLEMVAASGEVIIASRMLLAIGGSANPRGYDIIRSLGHTIVPPIPSLFTFNDADKRFADLMGVSVSQAYVRIATTRYSQVGPLLITHWGLSGPAVIKLSAWAAEYLHSVNYRFTAIVSWIGTAAEDDIRAYLFAQKAERSRQKICTNPLFELPQRLWERLCHLAEIPEEKVWSEVAHRNLNKLLEYLIRSPFDIRGKTTFKEEFVTCGGIDLSEVDMQTLESKKVRGVFFAGEVLHIDGETGGFNFQAAWSTAYVAATSMFFGQAK